MRSRKFSETKKHTQNQSVNKMLMPGATDTDAALAANVIVRASFDSVIPGECFVFVKNCY